MARKSISTNEILIAPQPIPAGALAFSERVQGLMDGQPKDDATVARALEGMEEIVDKIAAGLYSIASMLVGEGEQSVRLVEKAIATAEVTACQDAAQGRKSSRRALCAAALETIARRDPGSLAAPEGLKPAGTCIEDDDLEAAGVSSEELEQMIAGPDRERVRTWIESLPTAMRTVFVMRAVAGFTAAETAGLLKEHGGPKASGWSAVAAREIFREGLCSLASQLLHASAAR